MRIELASHRSPDLAERLRECDVLVCTMSLRGDVAELACALGTLDAAELDRYAAYANEVVARRFAIGRARVRELLERASGRSLAGIPFRVGKFGKPSLAPAAGAPSLWFSVAHCEELGLVAISRRADVGVDVERTRDIDLWERVADRVLHPDERVRLDREIAAGADAGATFLGYWCRVEAELKAIGSGIAGLDAHRAGMRPTGLDVRTLDALPLPVDLAGMSGGYRAAVALCSPGASLVCQTQLATPHALTPVSRPATASTP